MNRRGKGFTLLELAVVLVIMGVVGYVFYGTLTRFVGQAKIDQAEEDVITAKEKLRGFVEARNGTLPTAGPDDTLNPALGDINDPWGRPYRYFLPTAPDLTTTSVYNATVTSTDLDVNIYNDADDIGTAALPERSVTNVAYVVISEGPNQQQDFAIGSVDILAQGGDRQKADGTTYDDIVEYVTLQELRHGEPFVPDEDEESEEGEAPPGFVYSMQEDGEAGGSLEGSAGFVPAPGASSGVTALDLTGNDQGGGDDSYLDLSDQDVNDTTLHDYTTYTIMGWYITEDSTVDDFATITSRQQGSNWANRTWWVSLWDDGFLSQGGGKTPGELALKAQSDGGSSFFADSNYPSQPAHHDGEWHFFAARISESGGDYTSEVFVSDKRDGGAETLLKGAATTTLGDPPKTGANYDLYIGYNSGNRYFRGYISGLLIYDSALSDTQIQDYFAASKADYGY